VQWVVKVKWYANAHIAVSREIPAPLRVFQKQRLLSESKSF
jgi:hypothetical protein